VALHLEPDAPVLPETHTLSYVGRARAGEPATGSYKIHQQEEADLINRAFARERGARVRQASARSERRRRREGRTVWRSR
jgi:hypothetical protein